MRAARRVGPGRWRKRSPSRWGEIHPGSTRRCASSPHSHARIFQLGESYLRSEGKSHPLSMYRHRQPARHQTTVTRDLEITRERSRLRSKLLRIDATAVERLRCDHVLGNGDAADQMLLDDCLLYTSDA